MVALRPGKVQTRGVKQCEVTYGCCKVVLCSVMVTFGSVKEWSRQVRWSNGYVLWGDGYVWLRGALVTLGCVWLRAVR